MGDPVSIAAVASLASVGFTAAGDITKAKGASEADQFKADQLARHAEYGELKAEQASAQLTRNLSIQLGNIDAVRAASRTDPTSPTGAAVRDYVESVGGSQKSTQVDTILAQSREDEAGAAYLRHASSAALLSGDIAAGADITKGLAGLPFLKSKGT